jgi:hypothetical protein
MLVWDGVCWGKWPHHGDAPDSLPQRVWEKVISELQPDFPDPVQLTLHARPHGRKQHPRT